MADTYSTSTMPDDANPADDVGGAEGGPEQPKISQQEANYRAGNLIYHCGLCKNFEGAVNGTCIKVDGNIIPYGLSDEYDGFPNPLKHLTPPQFQPKATDSGVPADAADAQTDQYDEPSPPALQIGRKVY